MARELRRHGIDVLTSVDAGLLGAPDTAYLEFGLATGRVVVTDDDDFLSLDHDRVLHAGIAYFASERSRSIGQMVELLRIVHGVYTTGEMIGRIEYL